MRILTVFGSAARGEERARDLDVGVMFEPGTAPDHLAMIAELARMTGTELIDLVHLNRGGPLLRERALVGSVVLYESSQAPSPTPRPPQSANASTPAGCAA